LNNSAVQFVLSFDHITHQFISQWLINPSESGAHKGNVVHTQRREIIIICKLNIYSGEDFSVGLQMNAFIINDDAVEIKEDCMNHDVSEARPSGRATCETSPP